MVKMIFHIQGVLNGDEIEIPSNAVGLSVHTHYKDLSPVVTWLEDAPSGMPPQKKE